MKRAAGKRGSRSGGKAPAPPLRTVHLTESVRFDRSSRWDEAAGVFRDFKILGFESDNGRRYEPEAVRRAVPLYEGKLVNCDHPGVSTGAAGKPTDQRSVYDRLGKYLNVRFVEGEGLRGDFKPFQTHEMFARLKEAAADPDLTDCLAFSHNSDGRGRTVEGIFIVEEITNVRHVDLVADGATTRSLVESRQTPAGGKHIASILVRNYLDACTTDRRLKRRVRASLMEALDRGPLKALLEDDEGPMMDEPGAEEDPHQGIKDAYKAAAAKHMEEAFETGNKETLKKVNDLHGHYCKLNEKMEEAEGDAGREGGEGGKEKEDQDEKDSGKREEITGKDEDDGKKDKPMGGTEGRRGKTAAGSTPLTEGECRDLCDLAGIARPSAELLESMQATGSQRLAAKLLRAVKGQGSSRGSNEPRSSGPGGHVGNGKAPATSEAFLESISVAR